MRARSQSRKGLVKTPSAGVKKASGQPSDLGNGHTFGGVAVLAYVLLTIAIFALFGLVQKLLES